MQHISPALILSTLLFGCSIPKEEAPREPSPSVSAWTQVNPTEWRADFTIHGEGWNLHAIHRDEVLYLRQWKKCSGDSPMPTEEISAHAKSVLPILVRRCDGSYGMALVDWFQSEEFLRDLPKQVRGWYEATPKQELKIIVPVEEPGKKI